MREQSEVWGDRPTTQHSTSGRPLLSSVAEAWIRWWPTANEVGLLESLCLHIAEKEVHRFMEVSMLDGIFFQIGGQL